MALKIDTGLWGGLPLSSSRSLNLTMRLVFLDQRKEEANRQLPYEGELTGVAVANFLLKQGLQGTGGAADREKDEL